MDGQLSRKKVIGSPIYEESLERVFVEGIKRSGIFQARKYLEHILSTVEELENGCPYYPECQRLAIKSRTYRNIILDSHLIIYRTTEEHIEMLDIVHSASSVRRIKQARNIHIEWYGETKKDEPPVSDPPPSADI